MTQQLIQVPFHGDVIEATQDERGVWVPLRRPCESLGIDASRQVFRLKKKAWACATMMVVQDNSGRNQEMFCLHQDSFPMWLATIESSRVAEHIRPKLELYQKEAAKVLADHFLGKRRQPEFTAEFFTAFQQQTAALQAIATTLTNLVGRVEQLERSRHTPNVAGPQPIDVGQFFGIRERVRQMWPSADERRRKRIVDRVRSLALRRQIVCCAVVANGPLVLPQVNLPLVDEVIDDIRAEMPDPVCVYPLFDRMNDSVMN